jgi:hypothetical protein
MRIGLIDVDGHNFPNLPLMKISKWHKQQGDTVEWFFPLAEYDRVYMSKVFTDTPDFETSIRASEIIKGGTGYDLENKLPDEIESISPDYTLYGIKNIAYGFLTRGCPRNCPFCIVTQKEGQRSVKVADLQQFWNGQRHIKLLDPNLLACGKDRYDMLQQLIDSQAWVDITQGLDARLITPLTTHYIKQLKVKMLHFAWDNIQDEKVIVPNLKDFKKASEIDFRRLRVYVLTNFNSTMEQDLYRVYKLRDIGYDPYVMIYDKKNAPRELRRLARWVNNKFIFRQCERFEDYQQNLRNQQNLRLRR